MIIKILELRDRNTFIPVLAVSMRSNATREQDYLLMRAGYTEGGGILLTRVDGDRAYCDPYDWGDRTFQTAHLWLEKHFGEVRDGDVIDVEFILGETKEPKISERFTARQSK